MSINNWQQDWQNCNKQWSKCNWYNWNTFQLTKDKQGEVIIPNSYKQQLQVFGVYIVFANNNLTNGFSFQMPKNKDKWGILTIGESMNLYTRLNTFIKCAINLNNNKHSAGNNFYYLDLGKKLPVENLWISFLPASNIDNKFCGKSALDEYESSEAKQLCLMLEYELTLAYLVHHGELPILTSKLQKPVKARDIFKENVETPSFYQLNLQQN